MNSALRSEPIWCLRMVSSHGVPTDHMWLLETEKNFSMMNAFAVSPVPVTPIYQTHAARCFITTEMIEEEEVRWLVNNSTDIVCVVNQERLLCGNKVQLQWRDVLEIGLLRFIVELVEEGEQLRREPVFISTQVEVPSEVTEQSDSDSSDPFVSFELTDLLKLDPQHDSFNDDGLNSLLNQSRVEQHVDVDEIAENLIADIDVLDCATGSTLAENSADLMCHLHAQYLQLMQAPHEIASADNWNLGGAEIRQTNDELEDLTGKADLFDSLYDILGQEADIDSIMRGLDTLGGSQLLNEETYVDVLRLFAPPRLKRTLTGQNLPPSLTRREHHALTVDSVAYLDYSINDDINILDGLAGDDLLKLITGG